MKLLVSGIRTLMVAFFALLLILAITLSQGWHTPAVNYFAAPYKVSVVHTDLSWFPFSVNVEGLKAGEGSAALKIDRLRIRSGLGFLSGQPVELYVQAYDGYIAYQAAGEGASGEGASGDSKDWQVAGLRLSEWQQLLAGDGDGVYGAPSVTQVVGDQNQNQNQNRGPIIHLHTFQLQNVTIDSLQAGLPDIQLDRVLLGPFYSDQPEKHTSLQLALATAGGTMEISGALSPLSATPSLSLDIQLHQMTPNHQWLTQIPQEVQLTLNSRLALAVTLNAADDGREHTSAQRVDATLSGDLQLQDIEWAQASGQEAAHEKEQVATGTYLAGKVALEQLTLRVSVADLTRKQAAVHFSAEQLALEQADLRNPDLSYRLKSLTLQQLALRSDTLITQEIPAVGIDIGQVQLEDSTLQLAGLEYQLDALSLKPLRVRVDASGAEVALGYLALVQGVVDYQLAVNKGGGTQGSSGVGPVEREPIEREPAGGTTGDIAVDDNAVPYDLVFSAEQIRLQNHQVTYQDLNLKGAPLTQLEVTEIALIQPRYPAAEPFAWLADFWLNGQSQWQIRGDLQTAPLNVAMTIDQTGLYLPDISPYSGFYADVFFTEGVMDNRINLTMTPDSLKGSLGFDFSNLDMTLKGEQASLNLPLQAAFALLEDADGRIELTLDLDKKGQELKVGTRTVVQELLLAASQKGSLAYLKYALQPFGALLTLKDVGSSLLKSGAIPLEPVVLEPMQEGFTSEQQGYARKISGILKDKKDLKLNYCYQGGSSERPLLLKQLGDAAKADAAVKALHQNRLTQWRKLFAEQGLASRLSLCAVDDNDTGLKTTSEPSPATRSQFTLLLKP